MSTLDAVRLAEYLRTAYPADAVTVTSLTRNVGGMSRQTWFADVAVEADGQTRREQLTIRSDHPDGSVVPVSLRQECDIFRAVGRTEVPVAEVLWYSDDPELIGQGPFYVRRMVPGSASVGRLFKPGNADLRRELGRDFARQLARVHTADWRAAGFADIMPVPSAGPECALLELDRWQGRYEDNEVEPLPWVTELFCWLRRNAPARVERVSLVWGDVGLGNFIYDGPRIVALTDWEQAHLGDPMKDWGSALWRGVDGLLPREEMFEIYERESGIRVDEASVRYYQVFIDAQYVSISLPLLRAVRDRDVTFARLGLGVPYRCMEHALTAIDAAASSSCLRET